VKLNHPPVEQDPVVTISPPQQVPGAQQNIENTPSVSDRLRELEEALKQAQATIEEQKRSAERFQQETTARQQQEEERHKIEEERLRQEVEAKYKQEKEKMKKQQELIQEKLKEGFVELKNQVQNSLESDKKQREETTNQQLDTTKINKAITNKEALLEQLNSIINDSTTIILEPENCVSEYQVNAPFAKKQAFINGLRKFHTPVLGDLMLAAKDESDPFNVDVVKLAKRIGLQIEELQDLELRIEVHNLDLQNDLASRRERIIKGIHSDSASRASVDGKPKNTSSDSKGIVLTFGAKTNSNKSVVINIDPDNQDNMLQSVVARDIREYEETIHANKVGVVLTGKIPSRNTGTVYVSGITNKPTKNK
jgi:hypothetical protein